MASTLKMEYQVFLCIFQKGLFCWLGELFPLPSQRNFPIFFKPKVVAIAEFFWKMQRKTWYSILRVDAMPLSLKKPVVK